MGSYTYAEKKIFVNWQIVRLVSLSEYIENNHLIILGPKNADDHSCPDTNKSCG